MSLEAQTQVEMQAKSDTDWVAAQAARRAQAELEAVHVAEETRLAALATAEEEGEEEEELLAAEEVFATSVLAGESETRQLEEEQHAAKSPPGAENETGQSTNEEMDSAPEAAQVPTCDAMGHELQDVVHDGILIESPTNDSKAMAAANSASEDEQARMAANLIAAAQLASTLETNMQATPARSGIMAMSPSADKAAEAWNADDAQQRVGAVNLPQTRRAEDTSVMIVHRRSSTRRQQHVKQQHPKHPAQQHPLTRKHAGSIKGEATAAFEELEDVIALLKESAAARQPVKPLPSRPRSALPACATPSSSGSSTVSSRRPKSAPAPAAAASGRHKDGVARLHRDLISNHGLTAPGSYTANHARRLRVPCPSGASASAGAAYGSSASSGYLSGSAGQPVPSAGSAAVSLRKSSKGKRKEDLNDAAAVGKQPLVAVPKNSWHNRRDRSQPPKPTKPNFDQSEQQQQQQQQQQPPKGKKPGWIPASAAAAASLPENTNPATAAAAGSASSTAVMAPLAPPRRKLTKARKAKVRSNGKTAKKAGSARTYLRREREHQVGGVTLVAGEHQAVELGGAGAHANGRGGSMGANSSMGGMAAWSRSAAGVGGTGNSNGKRSTPSAAGEREREREIAQWLDWREALGCVSEGGPEAMHASIDGVDGAGVRSSGVWTIPAVPRPADY